jgi:hypothetical protein
MRSIPAPLQSEGLQKKTDCKKKPLNEGLQNKTLERGFFLQSFFAILRFASLGPARS